MLEYICYTCIATYYCSFCAFAGYTCYKERQEEREHRRREYQQIIQHNPPSLQMIPEREYSRQMNILDPITEELEESFEF